MEERFMNNVFDIKRFGKFFSYELNNARYSFGLSLLIIGLLPAILFIFTVLFKFLSGIHVDGPIEMGFKITCFICALFVVIMASPSRLYGHLTEKKKGTAWLMIPASSLEKTVSVVLIVCFVVPVCCLAVYFCCDLLVSSLFPATYGPSVTGKIFKDFSNMGTMMSGGDNLAQMSASSAALLEILSVSLSILGFTLGAICFKRHKAGKTLLCYFALSIIFSTLIIAIFGHNMSFDSNDFEDMFFNMEPEKVQRVINWTISLFFTIWSAILLVAVYFRIKTIKH